MLPNWLTQWRHMMGNRFVGSSNLDAVASSPFGGVQSDIDFTEKSVGGPQPPLLGKQETEADGDGNRSGRRLDRTLPDAVPEHVVFRANLLVAGMSRPFDSKCSELLHSDFDRAIDAVRGVERYPQAGYGGEICRADGPQSQS